MSQWLTPLVPELVSLASNFLAFKVIPPKKNLTYDFCQTFTSCYLSFSVLKYKIKRIPYWYLISRVLNFAILTRQYFAGFYFRDFNTTNNITPWTCTCLR